MIVCHLIILWTHQEGKTAYGIVESLPKLTQRSDGRSIVPFSMND